MDTINKIIKFRGHCQIKTKFHLEKLAHKVSKAICGGIPFVYGEHSIWEEIPAMYLDHSILGMLIIIGGYGKENGFCIEIDSYGEFSRYVYNKGLRDSEVTVRLDLYLYHLLKQGLAEYPEIEIIEPKSIK
mgnify:CR=1 FL=1